MTYNKRERWSQIKWNMRMSIIQMLLTLSQKSVLNLISRGVAGWEGA